MAIFNLRVPHIMPVCARLTRHRHSRLGWRTPVESMETWKLMHVPTATCTMAQFMPQEVHAQPSSVYASAPKLDVSGTDPGSPSDPYRDGTQPDNDYSRHPPK